MIIKQIHSADETGTLSYIVTDASSGKAVIIDPNIEDVDEIVSAAKDLNVELTHIIDTHTHADHISGADKLKEYFPAKTYMHEKTKDKMNVLENAAKFGIEDILRANAKIVIDHYVNDGDELEAGSLKFKILHTPGHTDNHISIFVEDALFTGDLLLIGQAGRSDLPGGDTGEQYDSLFNKIVNLPQDTKIYPGHDYDNNSYAFLKDELQDNPFLQKRTKEEYIEFVKDFFPPFAEATSNGEKVTLQCGTKRVVQNSGEFKSISAQELFKMISNNKESLYLLDVREPYELMMTGAVDEVVNIPMGELTGRLNEIPKDDSKKIVCICASGNRSYEAAHFLAKNSYQNVLNLEGGTYGWLMQGYEVER